MLHDQRLEGATESLLDRMRATPRRARPLTTGDPPPQPALCDSEAVVAAGVGLLRWVLEAYADMRPPQARTRPPRAQRVNTCTHIHK